jgi:hypothetical protein
MSTDNRNNTSGTQVISGNRFRTGLHGDIGKHAWFAGHLIIDLWSNHLKPSTMYIYLPYFPQPLASSQHISYHNIDLISAVLCHLQQTT